MFKRLTFLIFVGFIYGDDKTIFENPLLKEIHAFADSLAFEIPLESSVYIADHTDFGGLSSYFGGYVADQIYNHLSNNDYFTLLDRNPIQILLDQQNLESLDMKDEKVTKMFEDIVGAEIIVFGTITEFANKISINSRVMTLNDFQIVSSISYTIKKTREIANLISAVYLKNKEELIELNQNKQDIYEHIASQNKKFNDELNKYKEEKLSIIKREYDIRVENLKLEEDAIIKSFPLGYQNVVLELVKLKGEDSQLYSSTLTNELFRLETEYKEKKIELAALKEKRKQISTIDTDIKDLHQEIDKVSEKLSVLKMGMTVDDVIYLMGDRFSYDGRCGNFGKYVLVFSNNTLIKACKVGEIYTQFGEYAIVNDCEDCDDMEVKNLLKY